MLELIDSVRQFGILVPAEVRPCENGGYEIIAGARRHRAAQLANLDFIPAIIMDFDDDAAIIRMVDSNIQRECTLPSERARAYKMRMEAMKRQAGRPQKVADGNSPKISANYRSDDELGLALGISGDTIRNYISLTNLIQELMQMVDEGKIKLSPAYQIASLTPKEQALLLDTIESEQATPSFSQALRMKRLSQSGELDEDTILEIMMEQKKPVRNEISLSTDKLRKYFPKHYSPVEIENAIFKLLDAWYYKCQQDRRK